MSALSISSEKQGWIGSLLASAIIAAWLALHFGAVFMHELPTLVLGLLLVVVLTWLSVGLFIVAHDAMHRSLLPNAPVLNDMIGSVALALYANFSYRNLRPFHHRHHKSPGVAGDPDFSIAYPNNLLRWYWHFMRQYFGWREAGWMMFRIALYILLGANVPNILLFFALPGLLSSLQLFYFGTFLPHRRDPSMSPFVDKHNARSNAYGFWFSLLSCFHFGYHYEHHVHPQVPWWRLPLYREKRDSHGG